MQYALLFYQSPDEFAARSRSEEARGLLGELHSLHEGADRRGIVVAGAGLEPPDVATSIRLNGGKRQVQDGPFAEAKEQLGGFFIIDVANLDVGARMGGSLSGRAGRRRRGAPGPAADGPREDVECGRPRGRRRSSRAIVPDGRVSEAVEQAARRSYGRLLAFLAARSRDVTAAEDCLADAFHAALTTWPRDGVPDNPEAWLLTVARRRSIDMARRATIRQQAEPDLILAAEEAGAMMTTTEFPDERLKLLFVCAHPAIDAAMHTPLMLQTVLGLNAIAHRVGLPGEPRRHGPAAVAGQGQDQGCRNPVRGAGSKATAAAPARCARGDLCRLWQRLGRSRRPAIAMAAWRGDHHRPHAGRADARRAGGAGPVVADASLRSEA